MVPRRKSKTEPPPADCPLNTCLNFVRGAWTLEIFWFLRAGPRRFSELQWDLKGVSAKVLVTRLRRLEADGFLLREVMPTSPPTVEYRLTRLGQRMGPVLDAMVEVGNQLKRRMK